MISPVDQALSDCFDRLQDGATVGQCLEAYPEHADELRPMLRTAAATIAAAAAITPRPEGRRRSRYAFNAAVAEARNAPSRGPWNLGAAFGGWRGRALRTAAFALGAVAIAGSAAFGATRAAEDTVPGDALYAVKTFKENVSLRLPKSDLALAKEHARLANVRTQEIANLINLGRLDQANLLVVRVTYHLNSSAHLVGVTITANANPLEMPARSAPQGDQQSMSELASYYERDAVLVRTYFSLRLQRLPKSRQRTAYIMMQHWEMMNRLYLQALSTNGPPVWPVWIDQGAKRPR